MQDEANFGLSIGDVMTALLLIIILVMMNALSTLRAETDKTNEFEATRKHLNAELYREFEPDFKRLYLDVDTVNGVINFSSPTVLFDACSETVKLDFQVILQEFYPRYLEVLTQKEFKDVIDEVRVEGHTSSDWGGCRGFTCPLDADGLPDAYLCNLRLSQNRSFEVLNFLLQIDEEERDWFQDKAVAMGYSYSNLVYYPYTKVENIGASRRVSFRALLDYEQFMVSAN